MRKSERINQLELEIYKMRIEIDLMHNVLENFLQAQELRSMDAGKWYPRRPPRPDING